MHPRDRGLAACRRARMTGLSPERCRPPENSLARFMLNLASHTPLESPSKPPFASSFFCRRSRFERETAIFDANASNRMPASWRDPCSGASLQSFPPSAFHSSPAAVSPLGPLQFPHADLAGLIGNSPVGHAPGLGFDDGSIRFHRKDPRPLRSNSSPQ